MTDTSQTNTAQQVAAPQFTPAQLLEFFIKLRDQKKALAEKHAAEMKPINEAMAAIDTAMLAHCQQHGIDSIKVKGIGSATTAVSTSYSLENPEMFQQYVIANQRWDMINWAANKEACEGFTQEFKVLPPGVKSSSYRHMNVRRASKKAADSGE